MEVTAISQPRVGFGLLPKPIISHLEDALVTWPVQPHVYHVTELVRCLRQSWYRRVYPERVKWTVKSLWNIYRGNLFDQKLTSLFEVHQKNYKIKKDGITISGTLDFVYDNGEGPVLYDLKMPASTFYRKREGAGQSYQRQVQAYLALGHVNGELLDVHRCRVLMVAGDVVVEDVPEWVNILDEYLLPRAFALDHALGVGSPAGLPVSEEGWECACDSEGVPYCPADSFFRKVCFMTAGGS